MKKLSGVWAVTSQNRRILAAVHASLQQSYEEIARMLDEDDFPVEFFHKSGLRRIFRSSDDLRRFISQLGEELKAA